MTTRLPPIGLNLDERDADLVTSFQEPESVVRVRDQARVSSCPLWRSEWHLRSVAVTYNAGAIIRSCAALGVDAVLVSPRCADPLYRRSIRVSMGTVFQVPWTRLTPWPGGVKALQDKGFVVAGLTLSPDAVSLDELAADPPERLALVLGTEGDGLSSSASALADLRVRIPMGGGVDSLNVAAAAAVAFYASRPAQR